jgi:uncharacterized protein (TIGR03435 family)
MLSIILSFLFVSLTIPQTAVAPQRPSFEVASIKPYVAPAPGTPQFRGFQNQPGGRVNVTGMPLKAIITFAYGVRDFQVSGGPDWINADLWEIVAKAEDGAIPQRTGPRDPTAIDPTKLMMQSLLEDQFKLKIHKESKELPTYELVPAKGGARIQLSADQTPPGPPAPGSAPPPPPAAPRGQPGAPPPPGRGGMFISGGPNGLTLQGNATALTNLIFALAQNLGRIVVDKTELPPGLYDFKMQWSPDPAQGTPFGPAPPSGAPGVEPPRPTAEPTGPSLFTAIQEQLGLRLVSSRGPVDVYVIDSAQKPAQQ